MSAELDTLFAGAMAQARMLRQGELSAPELVRATLERIEAIDPTINAFRLVLDEEALADAQAAQARLAAGDESPLLGVPVAVKDDVDLAGAVTARGTHAQDDPATEDCELVRRLRRAGAVIVGKTNVSELTAWPFTESAAYGATRNPWCLERTPGGSSGGSAAAVAAGMCGLGSGGDGGGSIRIPAAWCGLFGLKPQRGRVPLAPRLDAWQGLAVNGPLARHAIDAALYLDAVSGTQRPRLGFASECGRAPRRLRIALTVKPPPGAEAEIDGRQRLALEQTEGLLRSLGHEVVERDVRWPVDAVPQVAARMLRGIHDDLAALAHPERVERRVRSLARAGQLIPTPVLRAIRRRERVLAARIDELLAAYDVLLTPGPLEGPWRVGELAGRGALATLSASAERAPFQSVFNASGHPACSLPAGFDPDGLPLGVQLVGRKYDEQLLLSLAAQMEAVRPWAQRRPFSAASFQESRPHRRAA